MLKSLISHTIARALALTMIYSAIAPAVVTAADQPKLLQGKSITESNLIDALAPAVVSVPYDETVESGRTRGLRVTPSNRPLATQSGTRPHKAASAAILITFETNSAKLTQHSKQQLGVVAAALKNYRLMTFRFEVDGHADSRGTAEANMMLSKQRAESVCSYLINYQNISSSRLFAIGKGDSEPMNIRDVAAAENRRVTFNTLLE